MVKINLCAGEFPRGDRDRQMTLVLHYISGSTATIPHAVIEEAGLPYRLRALPSGVDQVQREHYPEAGFKLSGRIPALEDDTAVVFETGAIITHIVSKPGASHLAPPYGSKEYARFMQWLFYLTTSSKASMMEIMWPERWGKHADDQEWIKERAQERLATQCDYLDANVSEGTFLPFGLTALDFYLTELARWSAAAELPLWRWKRINAVVEATRHRPAYKRMLAMQGLIWPG